ncbi:MAG: NmrA family NAD(P)-binding protein [Chloroflexi bacterium]|nr:NmrA family NAD(P)-binding protein [Chloroflexota bacterium]
MKVLVTGAGGKTGRAIIAALARRGATVRPFLRRAASIPNTIEPVIGDMAYSADWERALAGMDKVYHICPNMHEAEVEIGRLAIAAARKAGVTHFVYHSVMHPQTEDMPHHWRKLRVEEALLASQTSFTILQPTAYMQNIRANWQTIMQTGLYVTPYPVATEISLVDLADVAEAAAIVLTEAGHVGATYELVGTAPLSQVETARQMGEGNGRSIAAQEIDLETWRQNEASGLQPDVIASLLQMFRYYAAYGFVGNTTVLRCLLGREPTSLVDCVQRW